MFKLDRQTLQAHRIKTTEQNCDDGNKKCTASWKSSIPEIIGAHSLCIVCFSFTHSLHNYNRQCLRSHHYCFCLVFLSDISAQVFLSLHEEIMYNMQTSQTLMSHVTACEVTRWHCTYMKNIVWTTYYKTSCNDSVER